MTAAPLTFIIIIIVIVNLNYLYQAFIRCQFITACLVSDEGAWMTEASCSKRRQTLSAARNALAGREIGAI